MDSEFIALILTLFGGFGGTYALLWQMKGEIEQNKREFAKCPLHCKEANHD
ncbi:hypothetical protein [Methanorbis furvi]|uniref:Phage protein n=1 Tax=Methanorbis furvi TaxID=3028299 RepID=A0AAE4SBB6_9EURY|nr:hypothetical protein [Methanocorpusculaceae archaeon Ag1]MDV0442593.1 hypothetical protein [Methanocorpusculaceae archaeon Ag1]